MQILNKDDLILMQWHLVLCRPNQHHIAHRSLERLDCEVFLPQQTSQRKWRGRVIHETRPFFPGYLFVGMDPARPIWEPVRRAYGVSRIVGFGEHGPASVPSQIVAGLMARCDAQGILTPMADDFEVGDRVRIISGPFKDFVTQIDRIVPERRLHVLLDLLGRSAKVVLSPEMALRQD